MSAPTNVRPPALRVAAPTAKIVEQDPTEVMHRMFFFGDTGSGKTYTALTLASALGKVGMIDTENRANLYARKFKFLQVDQDLFRENGFHPTYMSACAEQLVDAGAEVIIVDSVSDFWDGVGGGMELQAMLQASGGRYKQSQLAWAEVNRMWSQEVRKVLDLPVHVIFTARETTDEKGNAKPACQKRTAYLFDQVLWFNAGTATVLKTDVNEMHGREIPYPTAEHIKWIEKLRQEVEQPDG